MRCFDGHCDTLARCLATGEGLRQNSGHVDLVRCAALGQHAQIFAVFADSAAAKAPKYSCPSTPIFQRPDWKAKAVAMPVRMIGQAKPSVCIQPPPEVNAVFRIRP